MSTRRPAAALAVLAIAAAIAAAGSRALGEPAPLRVFAAASLTEVVGALARRHEGTRVVATFGGSSTLARQIRDGAPADVFVSASPDWIDFLREAGALDGDAVVLARNRLVAVAPRGGRLAGRGIRHPPALLAALEASDRVAVADEGVPAGEVARRALAHLGVLDAFRPHLVGLKDVRAALRAVERGGVAAGLVYATDARVGDVEALFAFDEAVHPPIEYRAAALRRSPRPARARRFLETLRGDAARTLLADAGFALP